MQPSVIVMLSAAMGVIAMPLRPRPAQENSNNSTAQQSDQLLNQTSQAVGNPVAQQPDQLNNTSTTSPPMGNPVEQKPDQLNQTSSPIGGATAQQADQLNPTTTPPMDKPALQQSQPNQPNQSSPPMGTGSPSGSQPQPDRRNQIKPNEYVPRRGLFQLPSQLLTRAPSVLYPCWRIWR